MKDIADIFLGMLGAVAVFLSLLLSLWFLLH